MTLPQGALPDTAVESALAAGAGPSLTYRLDTASGRIAGMADGLDAMKQAVLKVLSTERYAHFIYSGDYGHEIRSGRDSGLFLAEIRRWVTEALVQDERILGIDGLTAVVQGDSAEIQFTVETVYGPFRTTQEVNGIG